MRETCVVRALLTYVRRESAGNIYAIVLVVFVCRAAVSLSLHLIGLTTTVTSLDPIRATRPTHKTIYIDATYDDGGRSVWREEGRLLACGQAAPCPCTAVVRDDVWRLRHIHARHTPRTNSGFTLTQRLALEWRRGPVRAAVCCALRACASRDVSVS